MSGPVRTSYADPVLETLELRRTPYDHPDPVALTALAQEFYVEIYGGPDHTPFTAEEFSPPHGSFLVGYARRSRGHHGRLAQSPPTSRPPAPSASPRSSGCSPVPTYAATGTPAPCSRHSRPTRIAAGADWMVLETGRPQTAAIAFYRAQWLCRHRAVRLLRRGAGRGQSRQASYNVSARLEYMADSKKIAFLTAAEGIERAELVDPWDAVTDAGHQPVLISPETRRGPALRSPRQGRHPAGRRDGLRCRHRRLRRAGAAGRRGQPRRPPDGRRTLSA